MLKTCPEGPGSVRLVAESLRRGGVVALPTETVYGLAALWECQEARAEIFRLKHRPAEKLLQMLAADLPQAAAAGVVVTPALEKVAAAFWPGPLTVVVPAHDGGTIGLRIPAHAFLLQVLQELGCPLAATSANRSGMPAAATADEAVRDLAGEPALLVLAESGSQIAGTASTVLSLLEGEPQILRPGAITLAQIQAVLRDREQP